MDNGARLYQRFLDGDDSGLEELVKLYNVNLVFYINGFVCNVAVSEDIAAETFAKLVTRKIRFKNDYAFKTWLFKIARNNAIDYLRRQSRWRLNPIEDLRTDPADQEILENVILKNEQNKQLHSTMQTMHNDYRDILHLIYFEEMSYAEAAKILAKSVRQIKNLAYRARQALKSALERDGFVYENI